MKDFRNLEVWKKAHKNTLSVYENTRSFPQEEIFGLTTNQMRRASVSIPSNIAERCGRGTDTELARFLRIAMGSASELEYQIFLSRDLKYLKENVYAELSENIIEIKKMLSSLIKKLNAVS
jgi:four helix bundle protein